MTVFDPFSYINPISEQPMKSPHPPHRRASQRRFLPIFNTYRDSKSAFLALGGVTRTFHHYSFETLLAVASAFFTQRVVLSSAVRADEHIPLGLPVLTSAHKSLTALSGSALGCSDFEAFSLSIIDGLSAFSSFLPLLMIPSIIP